MLNSTECAVSPDPVVHHTKVVWYTAHKKIKKKKKQLSLFSVPCTSKRSIAVPHTRVDGRGAERQRLIILVHRILKPLKRRARTSATSAALLILWIQKLMSESGRICPWSHGQHFSEQGDWNTRFLTPSRGLVSALKGGDGGCKERRGQEISLSLKH